MIGFAALGALAVLNLVLSVVAGIVLGRGDFGQ
jgi:hypothetical protein